MDNKTIILQAANALSSRSPQLAVALRETVRNGGEIRELKNRIIAILNSELKTADKLFRIAALVAEDK